MKNMFFSSVSVKNEERTKTFDGFIVIFVTIFITLRHLQKFTGQQNSVHWATASGYWATFMSPS